MPHPLTFQHLQGSKRNSYATTSRLPRPFDWSALCIERRIFDCRCVSLAILRQLDVLLEHPKPRWVPAPSACDVVELFRRSRDVENIFDLELPRAGGFPNAICRRHGWGSIIVGRFGQRAALVKHI